MSKEDRTNKLLEELVKWARVTSFPKVKELLIGILVSPEEKVAYQSSNGERTSRSVANIANVNQTKIINWWKTWINAGIAEAVPVQRGERARRIFSLDDFGIEVPIIEKRRG